MSLPEALSCCCLPRKITGEALDETVTVTLNSQPISSPCDVSPKAMLHASKDWTGTQESGAHEKVTQMHLLWHQEQGQKGREQVESGAERDVGILYLHGQPSASHVWSPCQLGTR